ncbi:hypothetical protein FGRA07_08087 [Fusarium graminearum]|nr:hypothetical protein FGRA07_08087 [Fusarium graminearum]
MSQQDMDEPPTLGQKEPNTASYLQNCVVFMGNSDQVLAASKSFAGPTELTSRLIVLISGDVDPVFLFEISFPLGEGQPDNENFGFGVKHKLNYGINKVEANDRQTIEVRFPREKTQAKCDAAPASIVDRRFRVKDKEQVCILTVSVTAQVTTVGYGSPFRSADTEVNSWVNDNEPIGQGGNLHTFLQQQSFTFLVAKGAVDFEKRLDLDRLPPPFQSTLRGYQFPPRYSHPNDLIHVTAVVQGTSQDIMWLNERREEIAATKFSGYFVTQPDSTIDKATSLYLVIARTPEFKHKQAWGHLQKGQLVKVALFDSPSDEKEQETWNAKIVSSSEDVPKLSNHPVEKHELVLIVQAKMKPDAPFDIKFFCSREAAQYMGFYQWMSKPAPRDIAEAIEAMMLQDAPATLRPLPVVNFREGVDKEYADEIVNEALPSDRQRFRAYLEHRPLGRYRHIYAMTASTLAELPVSIVDPNQGDNAAPDSFFYPPSNWKLHLSSVYWLLMLLRSPIVRSLHQDDAPVLHHLQQGIDQNLDIAGLRALVTRAIDWETFSGSKEYDIAMTTAGEYLNDIACRAKILCATPADSENDKRVKMFKLHAKGFAIDEASNMKRPNLYCVWGNTLSPLFVFGDPKQLRPTVMMLTERWPNSKTRPGEFINRYAWDARISALEYLQASGIPTYRYGNLDTTKASD